MISFLKDVASSFRWTAVPIFRPSYFYKKYKNGDVKTKEIFIQIATLYSVASFILANFIYDSSTRKLEFCENLEGGIRNICESSKTELLFIIYMTVGLAFGLFYSIYWFIIYFPILLKRNANLWEYFIRSHTITQLSFCSLTCFMAVYHAFFGFQSINVGGSGLRNIAGTFIFLSINLMALNFFKIFFLNLESYVEKETFPIIRYGISTTSIIVFIAISIRSTVS